MLGVWGFGRWRLVEGSMLPGSGVSSGVTFIQTGYVAYIPKDNWFVQLQHLYSRVQGTSFAALVWNCGNYGLFPSCSTKDSCKGMHGVKRHQEGDPTLDRNKPKTDITPRLRDPSLGQSNSLLNFFPRLSAGLLSRGPHKKGQHARYFRVSTSLLYKTHLGPHASL